MVSQILKGVNICLGIGIALLGMGASDIQAQERVPLTFMTGMMEPGAYSVDHYLHHYALVKGRVQPEGVKLEIKHAWTRDYTRMMMAGLADVGVITVNGYLMVKDQGVPLVMIAVNQIVLPVTDKSTNMMIVREASRIKTPKDLEGKKVGLPGLTSASAIYHRAIFKHKFGVDTDKITWVDKGTPELFALLKKGDIDAANLFGGVGDKAMKEPGMDVLYFAPKVWKEMTGMPFLTVIIAAKKSVVEKYPEALKSLLKALKQSKQYGEEHKKEILAEAIKEFGGLEEPGTIEQPFDLTEEHKKMVTLYARYALEQKIIRKEPAPADLFADLK